MGLMYCFNTRKILRKNKEVKMKVYRQVKVKMKKGQQFAKHARIIKSKVFVD